VIFQVEGRADLDQPSITRLRAALKSLRSYGPSSYASLTDDYGNYIQVAGGGIICMVERYEKGTNTRERAYHDKPSPIRPDGTILAFRAGSIPMRSDEWFSADQVVELFAAFLNGGNHPDYAHWRSAPGF
jgi:hypothetical protein